MPAKRSSPASPDAVNPSQLLVTVFETGFRLSGKEKEELEILFKKKSVKRKGFVLEAGNTCVHFTYVVSGCFRMYAIDRTGKEHNLEFAAENAWICDLSSFYSETASEIFIEALEHSVVLQIKRSDLIHLYANYPKLNTGFRIITERKYIALQQRMLQNISATAEERYLSFLQEYPHLINRVPNTQVAAYLGITPEFLSKIRKDLSLRKPGS